MKHLSDYIEQATSSLLKQTGAFFAFSNKQFDEEKKEGVKYVNMGAGLICPKENIEQFLNCHASIIETGMNLDLNENGKEGVIKRELANHECYYTGDIEPCVKCLISYPNITSEDIRKIFNSQKELQNA